MSIDALLTVAAILVAVVALIPTQRANDIRIRLSRPALLVLGTVAVLVHYWAFVDLVHALPVVREWPRPIGWSRELSPASLSYLCILAAGLLTWYWIWRPLPLTRLGKLHSVFSDALSQRRLHEALHLLETHLNSVERAQLGVYWQRRVRTRFLPTFGELHLKALKKAAARGVSGSVAEDSHAQEDQAVADPEALVARLQRGALVIKSPPERGRLVRRLISVAEAPHDAAQDIVRAFSSAPELIREIAARNPHLGVRLLRIPSTWIVREFADSFSRALLSDSESILYRELRRAENLDRDNVPAVDVHAQPLLTFICNDALGKDGAQLLWSFTAVALDDLFARRLSSNNDQLKGPLSDYHERGRWTSPAFAALYLLEVVVPRVAVAHQAQVPNLYVLSTFTSAILANLETGQNGDRSAEWPTPYHYLLYECVHALVAWVNFSHSRADLFHGVIRSRQGKDELVTVPQHAAAVLGRVMYDCLRSDGVSARFKGYLLGVWWGAYAERYRAPDLPLSSLVLDCLVRGGHVGQGDLKHRDGLRSALQHLDLIPLSKSVPELRNRFDLLDEDGSD